MKKFPDWIIQSSWWVSGIFATGALWYFLSIKEYRLAGASFVIAVLFALIAIYLHARNDIFSSSKNSVSGQFFVKHNEEVITFAEMARSKYYDVIKVNAHTHELGVMAEYKWIDHYYPASKILSQTITTLDYIKKNTKSKAKPIYFDVITIEISANRTKKIYFDISKFYGGASMLMSQSELSGAIGIKLQELYQT